MKLRFSPYKNKGIASVTSVLVISKALVGMMMAIYHGVRIQAESTKAIVEQQDLRRNSINESTLAALNIPSFLSQVISQATLSSANLNSLKITENFLETQSQIDTDWNAGMAVLNRQVPAVKYSVLKRSNINILAGGPYAMETWRRSDAENISSTLLDSTILSKNLPCLPGTMTHEIERQLRLKDENGNPMTPSTRYNIWGEAIQGYALYPAWMFPGLTQDKPMVGRLYPFSFIIEGHAINTKANAAINNTKAKYILKAYVMEIPRSEERRVGKEC